MRTMNDISGFGYMIQLLQNNAHTARGKEILGELQPYLRENELIRAMRETTQARQMIELAGTPPLPAMDGLEASMIKCRQGAFLTAEEIENVGTFLAAVSRMKDYLGRGIHAGIGIAYYEENFKCSEELRKLIEQSIRHGQVDDYASPLLRDLRREIVQKEEKIREKAESVLRNNRSAMADSFVVKRSGRLCVPVKKAFRGKIPGSVIDQSATGSTLFIEPKSVASLCDELIVLKTDEENEILRILYDLTDRIGAHSDILMENMKMFIRLDVMFAKAALSLQMNAVEPSINTKRHIKIVQGRHPMMEEKSCVPLDFEIGPDIRGIIITGPNTGGKTVAIKTVGLFCMMACSGLHLPCVSADICMNSQVLYDIGDGQSIEENLSTFSSHIINIRDILCRVNEESLVILDEPGSGTDPQEGMGIAIAVLEQLRKSGCLFLATTHYPEIKNYCNRYPEIVNARMGFDRESLRPLYRLEIGRAGESCALYIARRLGIPDEMIFTAAKEAYGSSCQLEKVLDFMDINGVQSAETHETFGADLEKVYVPRIQKKAAGLTREQLKIRNAFGRGDSVAIMPEGKIGIVVKPANDRGEVLVQVQKEKLYVNIKRLVLKVTAEQLYPEDYDFSIIFDTVENRKARHQMEKRHVDGLAIHLFEE